MSSPALGHRHKAYRCSFYPGRQDLYVRLGSVTVFVRDQERSLRFYRDQLGFEVASDARAPSGERQVVLAPPDGTAMLTLIAPRRGSAEYNFIGHPTRVAFLTESVSRKYEEWQKRGVVFCQVPQMEDWGMSAVFEDPDGNSFFLVEDEVALEEIEEHRREHIARHETEQMEALELENAREAQARLFPQTQPELATLEYSGICIQARTVGGDYYDFIELGKGRFGLVIGDISGKGTAAALLMANLQAHLRNLCSTYSSRPYVPFAVDQPQRLLQAVNRLFCDNTASRAFASLFFAEYDDTTRRLRYANCGHLPALILRRDNQLEALNSTSTVVGLFKEWECSVGEFQLACGDTFVFYTDGVTESFNEADEQFGEERLIEALRRHRELPSPVLLRMLVDEVRRFSPQKQHDDITLIAAKCR
ncbi:MAG TPA: SpoIIE family protein phosphatase [Candidatus Aquilonibacter sp.]|nr:SpoIIE family protein phosphatase [Candidatus Aquilonibacter sp.]